VQLRAYHISFTNLGATINLPGPFLGEVRKTRTEGGRKQCWDSECQGFIEETVDTVTGRERNRTVVNVVVVV
jgi:hypothetical protein